MLLAHMLHSNTLAALALCLVASTASAQTAPVASARVMTICKGFQTAMADLAGMAPAISARDEQAGVIQLAAVAELSHERCVSVHSLLFAYELVPPGSARQRVGEYVAFRLGQYAALKSNLEYANKSMVITKLPGVAREAQTIRDRLREFAGAIPGLSPK